MRKIHIIAILLIIAVVACGPTQPADEPTKQTDDAKKPVDKVTEEVTQPAQEKPPEAKAEEPKEQEIPEPLVDFEPYTELGCEMLLDAETFAETCNQTAENLVVTYKVGTRNCFVNIKHREEERLTAGITLTKHESEEKAMSEFERRAEVFNVGMDSAVGQRTYMFPKMDRETVNFVEGASIVEVGADTRLCSKHDLVVLSRLVDGKLRQAKE